MEVIIIISGVKILKIVSFVEGLNNFTVCLLLRNRIAVEKIIVKINNEETGG